MYAIVSSIFVFYIFYTVPGRTLATENGYILYEVEKIVCKNSSSAISECSGFLDYDIPDLSNVSFSASLSGLYDFRKQIPVMINSLKLLGEQCSKSGTKYLCNAFYPFRCEGEYIEVDTKTLLAACNDSRRDCSLLDASILDAFFNCSSILVHYNKVPKIPRTLNCEEFPELENDPYTCTANYKVGPQKSLRHT